MNLRISRRRQHAGFSMVELMVALVLGLVLTYAMLQVYLASKTAYGRQGQLNALQQNVRVAFEYLTNDTRMVGYRGCYTNKEGGGFVNHLAATALASNYALGIEGYEWTNASAGAYTLADNSPANVNDATKWSINPSGVSIIPVTQIAGAAAGDGLTPGSDVLAIRTVTGKSVRLIADSDPANPTSLSIENLAGGVCADGTTPRVSGLCDGSHALVASCQTAHAFAVGAPPSAVLTVSGGLGAAVYPMANSEVFPLHTIVYYVKRSSSGAGTSLYRRLFDGNAAGGLEQELIEGVESLQLHYGVDTDVTADSLINEYRAANTIADWSRVLSVRASLLLRANSALESDVAVAASGRVGDVTLTYPTTGRRYDRRVFSTTIAVRNKINYF